MKNIFNKINKTIRILLLLLAVSLISQVAVREEAKTINNNLNKTLDLHAMAEVIEQINYDDLYTPIDSYVGYLTGYGANCPLCSGFLGCTSQDVRDGRTTYNDKDYGTVRIVASSKSMPCGSIVTFESKRISDKPIFAIVLDRGVGGTALDLLSESEEYAKNNVGRSQIKYDLLRKGWAKRSE